MENILGALGTRYRTDKISDHGYHRYYHDVLNHLRDKSFNMMEIGVASYNSIDMWKVYFPLATIYGIDNKTEFHDERMHVFRGDQSSKEQLQTIISQIPGRCDFIIDDGSHIPEHQGLTFDLFFRDLLNDGGVYIIEDIETSYWKRGGLYGYSTAYGWEHSASIIERFKPVIDFINARYIGPDDTTRLMEKIGGFFSMSTLLAISSITFGQNCIIIKKKMPYEYRYITDKPYRFADYV